MVGGFKHLEKIWTSVGMMTFPYIMEKSLKKCSKPPTSYEWGTMILDWIPISSQLCSVPQRTGPCHQTSLPNSPWQKNKTRNGTATMGPTVFALIVRLSVPTFQLKAQSSGLPSRHFLTPQKWWSLLGSVEDAIPAGNETWQKILHLWYIC